MYLFINHKCPNRLCLALVIIYCNIKKGNISTTTYVMDAYYSSKQSILEAVKPSMWVGGLMYIISNYVSALHLHHPPIQYVLNIRKML